MAPDLAAHLVHAVFCRTVRELSEICFFYELRFAMYLSRATPTLGHAVYCQTGEQFMYRGPSLYERMVFFKNDKTRACSCHF